MEYFVLPDASSNADTLAKFSNVLVLKLKFDEGITSFVTLATAELGPIISMYLRLLALVRSMVWSVVCPWKAFIPMVSIEKGTLFVKV